MKLPLVGALAGALLVPRPALATYSVVAADGTTGEVGGAAVSCIEGFSVGIVYAGIPGVGVVHAQAALSLEARDEGARLLAEGMAASDALAAITDPAFDPDVATRQFLLVTAEEAAAFTGEATMAHASDRRGTVGSIRYAVAGNILTGAPVLERTADGFEAPGCDLASRLAAALEAGAENGEGDTRCTPSRPGTSAFLQVEGPSSTRVSIDVRDSPDPVGELRGQLDAWRQDNPCPASRGEGGAGGTAPPAAPSPVATPTADQGGCTMANAPLSPWGVALAFLGVVGAAYRRRPTCPP